MKCQGYERSVRTLAAGCRSGSRGPSLPAPAQAVCRARLQLFLATPLEQGSFFTTYRECSPRR